MGCAQMKKIDQSKSSVADKNDKKAKSNLFIM